MEAIGLAASITGLIMAGSEIVIALKPYFSHPDVATLAQTAHSEIHDFSYALIKLKPMIDGSEPLNSARATQIDIGQLSMTIAGCMVTFSVLEKEVDSMNDMLAGGKKKIAVLARRKWSRIETTMNTVIQRLQNHKGSLTLIFVILTCPSDAGARLSARRLLEGRTEFVEHSKSAADSQNHNLGVGNLRSSLVQATRNYHYSFEPSLYRSQPYRGRSGSTDSFISIQTSLRKSPGWSMISSRSNASVISLPLSQHTVSGLSLLDIPDLPQFEVPVITELLYNTRWYTTPKLHRATSTPGLFPSRNLSSSLLTASAIGDTDLVGRLLDEGANIEALDSLGATALCQAAANGHAGTVSLLLRRGAHGGMRVQNQTPLHLSVIFGCTEVVDVLLTHGAYINATNDNNLTPLHYAASTGNIHLAEILLQNGACPLITSKRGREIIARNAQFYSFYFGDGENPSLDRFADASGERRESALNYAIRDGRNGVDLLLLNAVQGQEPEVGGESSSLHVAATYGNEKAARILLNNGANIHLKDEYDRTPLHLACLHRQMGLVSLLLKRGANINARNFFGRTPLHDAVLDGDVDLSRALLDLGGYIITEKGHKMFLAFTGRHTSNKRRHYA